MKRTVLRRVCLILVALFIASLSVVSGVVSRYTSSFKGDQALATPEDFYFECNFEDGGLYLYPNQRDFTLIVYNHDALDQLSNFSATNVTYTVKLTENGSNPLREVTVGSGTLTGGAKSSAPVTIPQSDLTLGKTHTVEITTSFPFAKTITFEIFVVEDTVENYYTLTKAPSGNWVQLDLYIGTTPPAALTIHYGSELAPDNTHPLMKSWTTAAEKVTLTDVQLHPYTHYTLIFFGTKDVTAVSDKTALPDTITLE